MPFSLYKCMSRTFIGNVFKYEILQLVLILPLLYLPPLRQRQRLQVQHQRLKLQHQRLKVQHQLPKVQRQRRRLPLPLIHLQLNLLVVLHLVPVTSLAPIMQLGLVAFTLLTNARHSTGNVQMAMLTFW